MSGNNASSTPPANLANDSTQSKFKPTLGLLDGTMIVAGSMIGSGIFIVSADILRNVGGSGWLILVWLITGFMTITAAVSYGELSGMFPKAGGQYIYLKEAYNPLVGFVFGWSFFAVIQTGTIAAVGVAFSKFAAYVVPSAWVPFVSEDNKLFTLPIIGTTVNSAQVVSIILIIFLTYTNTRGLKGARWIQNIFTSTKLLSLFGLIIVGLAVFKPEVWHANWLNGWSAAKEVNGTMTPISGTLLLGGIAAAMVGSVFSSDAWNNVTFIAGEIKNPQRNIGLSLFLGTLIVTVIYVSVNFVYLANLPLNDIMHAEKDRVAISASNVIFGSAGAVIIGLMIMISTFGCNNGLILAGSRVYHTMAKDDLFFKKAGTLNKNAVPEWALWAQCVVACILCLSGKYGDLLDMISFVVVIFYSLTIFGIFRLRITRPNLPRPYKAFGYPVLPALYIIMGISFCTLLIIFKFKFTIIGLVIALAGIPLYYIAVANKKRAN